jgi:hypothetical protein
LGSECFNFRLEGFRNFLEKKYYPTATRPALAGHLKGGDFFSKTEGKP